MVRFGNCCIFRDQPIKFSTTTAMALSRMSRGDALAKLGRVCAANADALLASLSFCAERNRLLPDQQPDFTAQDSS